MQSLRITNIIRSQTGIRWHSVCGLLALAVPALLLSAKLLLAVYAAAGDLDPSYGNGGKIYAVDPYQVWGAVAQQADGKLVVGGLAPTSTSSNEAALWRFHTSGQPDTSFGSNGQIISAFSQPWGWFGSLLMQFDGRSVAAGIEGGALGPVLARYLNDDGTPAPADLRIGNVRIVPTPVNPGDLITYTIPVTNVGPGKAGHVTLTTQTATHTTFQSFSAPPGWVIYKRPAPFSTGVISCSTYELPAGSTVNFYLTVRVSSAIAPGTQISHASTLSSFMPDPNETNNTATRTITVQ
jgi:uncharacterized repeat protein (TIGR01451 family)